MPQFKSSPDRMLEIPQPAVGGLNLKDLEFEQEVNQSPYMKNVMYRNGAFGKRFGQEVHSEYADTIHAITQYHETVDGVTENRIFVHAGTKIYKYDASGTHEEVADELPDKKGLFVTFSQELYYLTEDGFLKYEEGSFSEIDHYIPDYMVNCNPNGDSSDEPSGSIQEDLNLIGSQFNLIYNGIADVKVYHVGDYDGSKGESEEEGYIDWDVTPTITVNGTERTDFTVNSTDKTITFTGDAPGEGDMNVIMTFTQKEELFESEKARIYSSRFYDTFGGANNNRLFLAGGGDSKYYYSNAYDLSYFPEMNYATLGNTEEDITGFGRQYNVLIVFKPREVYSVYSYIENSSTTVGSQDIGLEGFRSQMVNPRMGCDCPYSIQLVNNLLTWFNTKEGICTLVSTNIQDERNVRILSRNIERTNNFGLKGILDYNEDPNTIQSIDYNNKYFLVFPESGDCFMWDYEISPYHYSSTAGETPTKNLAWFLFDRMYVKQFMRYEKQLIYVCTYSDEDKDIDFTNKLIKLNSSFTDVNFEQITDDNDEVLEYVGIESFFMTPFFQFGAVEYLKNVKNIYVQCRGDTASVIDMWYYTEENTRTQPEIEPESIRIGGKLWEHFQWYNFQWLVVNWANTFRRKCNLKKVQMASFYFRNNEANRDMSITHIGLQYQLVKYIR